MLRYGVFAKGIETMCFKPALNALAKICPEMNVAEYKKRVKKRIQSNAS